MFRVCPLEQQGGIMRGSVSITADGLTIRLLIFLILLLAIATALPGCKKETEQARKYMRQGNRAFGAALAMGSELRNTKDGPIVSLASGDTGIISQVASRLKEIKLQVLRYRRMVGIAERYYKDISELSGVGEYIEYQIIILKAVENEKEIASLWSSLLRKSSDALERIARGEQVDWGSQAKEAQAALEKIERLASESAEIEKEALRLRKEKDL